MICLLRMVSSGMLRRLVLVRTDVSEELSASFIRVTRIGELGTTLAVTSNRRTLQRNIKSVLARATRCNIPEDIIFHSHRREYLKSYMIGLLSDGICLSLYNYNKLLNSAHFSVLVLSLQTLIWNHSHRFCIGCVRLGDASSNPSAVRC
jgi:hypothetical protein